MPASDVYEWAKASSKPSYTASEVGAATSSHTHSNYASTVSTTGSGNAVTAISQSGNTITATKGATYATEEYVENFFFR